MTLSEHAARQGFGLSARGLGLYRVVYGAFALLVVAPGHGPYARFAALAELPPDFFAPPAGPFRLLHAMPPGWVVGLGEAALVAALVALTLGWRTRLASVATGVLLLGLYGLLYSFGKINHNLLFLLTPLVMAFSGWGAALSLDAQAETRRAGSDTGRAPAAWPLFVLALLVGLAWFMAGFSKLIGGWLDPGSRAVQGHVIKQVVLRARTDLLAPFAAALPGSGLWELADWTTVLFELSVLAAALHVRVARVMVSLAVLFHTGTALLMNISFFAVFVPVYAAFVDWDAVARRLPVPRVLRRARGPRRALVVLVALAVGAGLIVGGSPLLLAERLAPFTSDLAVTELAVLAGASCVAAAYLSARLTELLRLRFPRPRRLRFPRPRPDADA